MFTQAVLEGQVALVTGASRGIGSGIAKKLAQLGATVIVNYSGSKERAEKVVEEIEKSGGKAKALGCDISSHPACEQMIQEILKDFGRVDILVNNAGITRDGLLMRMSEADFDAVIGTNLKGAFNTIKLLSRQFLKQKSGKIINISSVSGVIGNAGQANYSASKAGIIGLTKSVARELGSRGICVNAIAPGFVDTEMTQAMGEEVLAKMTENIPLGRIGQVEEIADAVAFLASPSANYITGQVLCVDGGMAM